jgi:hypothetical protein
MIMICEVVEVVSVIFRIDVNIFLIVINYIIINVIIFYAYVTQ